MTTRWCSDSIRRGLTNCWRTESPGSTIPMVVEPTLPAVQTPPPFTTPPADNQTFGGINVRNYHRGRGWPAGMAAFVYATRKRLNAVLITGDIGGQLNWTSGVENYLGYQFIAGAELDRKIPAAGQPVPHRPENRL